MNKLSTLIMFSGALLALACQKGDMNRTDKPSAAGLPIQVEPVITRATETDFENDDAIGLTVSRVGRLCDQ